MLVVWIVLFVVVMVVSAFLALRSMKDYQEFPKPENDNSLFLVRNIQNFNLESLKKLHNLGLTSDLFFSMERLFKGSEHVLVIFGPKTLTQLFPDLNLQELEDYLAPSTSTLPSASPQIVNINQTHTFQIEPKNNPKKEIQVNPEFLKKLGLADDQRFFWQIVSHPLKKEGESPAFQVTLRGMVADEDPIARVNIAKRVNEDITQNTGLKKQEVPSSEQSLYESFKNRTLVPKEVSAFVLTTEEVYDLMGF